MAMAISAVNYPAPVEVNGFSCRNCSEVSLATRGVDPQHAQSGPANRDAAGDPSRAETDPVKVAAAQRTAEVVKQTPVGYSTNGPVSDRVEPGQLVSLRG